MALTVRRTNHSARSHPRDHNSARSHPRFGYMISPPYWAKSHSELINVNVPNDNLERESRKRIGKVFLVLCTTLCTHRKLASLSHTKQHPTLLQLPQMIHTQCQIRIIIWGSIFYGQPQPRSLPLLKGCNLFDNQYRLLFRCCIRCTFRNCIEPQYVIF